MGMEDEIESPKDFVMRAMPDYPEVRSCFTCAHRAADRLGEQFDHCRRWQCYCTTAIRFNCGKDLVDWRRKPPEPVKPPRRSLRRWLYDLLLAP